MAGRAKDAPREEASDTAVFLGDWHYPVHDPVAVALALKFVKWFGPDVIYIMGDFMDFEAVSSYDKTPEEVLSFQTELDAGRQGLLDLWRAAPNAKMVYIAGNHEHRLQRYYNSRPAMEGVDDFQIPSLLRLDAVDCDYLPYYSQTWWHGLLLEHGDRVRGKSCVTAGAMLESRGVCGLSGHTHRLGLYYRTDEAGVRVWGENGCLCLLRPKYATGTPNWQQGFTVGYGLSGKGRFILQQVPIIDGKLFYNGELWQ